MRNKIFMVIYKPHYLIKRRLSAGNEILQSIAVVHTLSDVESTVRARLFVGSRVARSKGIKRLVTAVIKMRNGSVAEIPVGCGEILFGNVMSAAHYLSCKLHVGGGYERPIQRAISKTGRNFILKSLPVYFCQHIIQNNRLLLMNPHSSFLLEKYYIELQQDLFFCCFLQ